jgi:formylglycine-generating enzyme required for sulfatase activity
MQPTGEQIEDLQRALLYAYNFDGLRTMVRIGLDAELEHVVPLLDRNLAQIVYATIRWAAAQEGGFVRLAQAALASNPENPELRAFATRYSGCTFDVLPLPGAGETQPPAARRAPLPFETVTIPAGPFLMGSTAAKGIPLCETPQFELSLPAYRIGKYPVTNAQYHEFVRAGSRFAGPELGWDGQNVPAGKRAQPVSGVTWYEAVAYCQWLRELTGCRCSLPTEAQWEKAARGTDGRTYPWGDDWEEGRSNHGGDGPAAAGIFPPQSPYGCCDMVGNVRQWASSLWGERLQAPDEAYRYPWREDATPAEASDVMRRVWRGGSFADPKEQLRCAFRGALFPTRAGAPNLRMGFRVVAEL